MNERYTNHTPTLNRLRSVIGSVGVVFPSLSGTATVKETVIRGKAEYTKLFAVALLNVLDKIVLGWYDLE